MSEAGDVLDRVFRAERARVLAALIRGLGDFELAEDALSEAAVTALGRWPVDGVPRDPVAWLVTVARRAALDRIRGAGVGAAKYAQVARAAGHDVSSVDELPACCPTASPAWATTGSACCSSAATRRWAPRHGSP